MVIPKDSFSYTNTDDGDSHWVEAVMISVVILAVGKYTYDKLTTAKGYFPKRSVEDSSSFAIKYLLNSDSLEVFNNLISEHDRISYIESYWKRYDPYPGDKENELKKEFDRRVSFANQNFSTPYQRGWRSDQGRIYILNGTPSEKILRPFEEGFFQSTVQSAHFQDIEMWVYDEPGERRDLPSVLLSLSGGRKFFLFGRLSGKGWYEQLYSSELDEQNHIELFQRIQ